MLSPKTVATALGVSESSVKRWIDGGDLAALRTVGGHRRVTRSEALRFARARGLFPARPELLAAVAFRIEDASLNDSTRAEGFHEALLDGHRPRALSLMQSAFVAGTPIAQLCDAPIRSALERIGELWKHNSDGIFVEHRALDLCLHVLGVLRAALPPPAQDAPLALGSAGPDDPYLLPSMMCATVLAEAGFRDLNLGAATPLETKLDAVQSHRPCLVWHSSSADGHEFEQLAASLRRQPPDALPRWVIGGRASAGKSLPADHFTALSGMRELQAYALGLHASQEGGQTR